MKTTWCTVFSAMSIFEMCPRMMIPDQFSHYHQMVIHYINRSCKIKPELKWRHCRTYTCCPTLALTKTIEKIGLILFLLSCNIFPLSFSIFSVFLIDWFSTWWNLIFHFKLVCHIYFIWQIFLTNSSYIMICKSCGMRSSEKQATEDSSHIWIDVFL